MTGSPEKPIQGKCLCGEVVFEVIPPARFCAHCHCTFCRRAHEAGFVTWAGFMGGQVRFLRGEEHLTRFKATPQATRTFCARCGNQLFFQGERWPGEIHVARAALPDESFPDDAGLNPTTHVYYSDRAPWLELHDGLERLGGPSGVEPLDGE